MSGKIVAIIGPARCGKSYLTKKLSAHYGVPAYYEGEEPEFPPEIVEDLSKNIRPLERFVYFHNKCTLSHLSAIEDSKTHPYVFLDTCWLTNPPWIGVYSGSPLEKQLLRELCEIDARIMPWPSVVLYLTADASTSRSLMKNSGRGFDKDFDVAMMQSKDAFVEYMKNFPRTAPLIEFDRSGLDFDDPATFKKITDAIEAA